MRKVPRRITKLVTVSHNCFRCIDQIGGPEFYLHALSDYRPAMVAEGLVLPTQGQYRLTATLDPTGPWQVGVSPGLGTVYLRSRGTGMRTSFCFLPRSWRRRRVRVSITPVRP